MAKMKYWNGSAWVILDAKDADTLDGKHASAFAASSHGEHVPTKQTADARKFLRNDNTWQTLPSASTSATGIVQLNNATNSTSTTQAATAAAVKAAYDKANHSHPTSLPANGGNADTVDGKHAADFAQSTHTHNSSEISDFKQKLDTKADKTYVDDKIRPFESSKGLTTGFDFNDIIGVGNYYASSSSTGSGINAPMEITAGYWFIEVKPNATNGEWVEQIATHRAKNAVTQPLKFFRLCTGGYQWSEWQQLATVTLGISVPFINGYKVRKEWNDTVVKGNNTLTIDLGFDRGDSGDIVTNGDIQIGTLPSGYFNNTRHQTACTFWGGADGSFLGIATIDTSGRLLINTYGKRAKAGAFTIAFKL